MPAGPRGKAFRAVEPDARTRIQDHRGSCRTWSGGASLNNMPGDSDYDGNAHDAGPGGDGGGKCDSHSSLDASHGNWTWSSEHCAILSLTSLATGCCDPTKQAPSRGSAAPRSSGRRKSLSLHLPPDVGAELAKVSVKIRWSQASAQRPGRAGATDERHRR